MLLYVRRECNFGVDLHLCSRMRSFVFYYTMVIVFCQVFVTCFLCDLGHIVLCCCLWGCFVLLCDCGFSCFWGSSGAIGGVSCVAYVLVWGLCVLGRVWGC